jgi:hypothetical protein
MEKKTLKNKHIQGFNYCFAYFHLVQKKIATKVAILNI